MHNTREGLTRRAAQLLAALMAAALVLTLAPLRADAAPAAGSICSPPPPAEETATAAVDPEDARAYICTLYEIALQRVPSEGELQYWTGILDQGPRTPVTFGIIFSIEAVAGFVSNLYDTILERPADSGGQAFFTNLILQGGTFEQVLALMIASDEFFEDVAGESNETYVDELYDRILFREPSQDELDFWVELIEDGTSRLAVAQFFLGSTEFATTQAETFYEFLDREPDAGGLAFWTEFIQDFGLLDATALFLATDEAFDEIVDDFSAPVNVGALTIS